MKFRAKNRRYRKKRKVCNANLSNQKNTQSLDSNDAEAPTTSTQNANNVTQERSSSTSTPFKPLVNKSSMKINSNNLFSQSFEASPSKAKCRLTRSSIAKLGLRTDQNSIITSYKLIDPALLNESLVSAGICKHCCKDPKSHLVLENMSGGSRMGLAEKLILKCSKRKIVHSFNSSKQIHSNQAYDVNMRSVYASQTMGHTGLKGFCETIGLPQPLTGNHYRKLMQQLGLKSLEVAEKLMNDAAKRLISMQFPDNINNDDDGSNQNIANVEVSVDGTWQRRGHCSKIGVVFVIAIKTGEVLDYKIKSLYCHQCNMNKKIKSCAEFECWFEQHKAECAINHFGSSASIETEAAVDIFLRSVEKRSLRYTTYVGDGDSSSFATVKEKCFEKYADSYLVHKEEWLRSHPKTDGNRFTRIKAETTQAKIE